MRGFPCPAPALPGDTVDRPAGPRWLPVAAILPWQPPTRARTRAVACARPHLAPRPPPPTAVRNRLLVKASRPCCGLPRRVPCVPPASPISSSHWCVLFLVTLPTARHSLHWLGREYSFLDNPRLPDSVWSSYARVQASNLWLILPASPGPARTCDVGSGIRASASTCLCRTSLSVGLLQVCKTADGVGCSDGSSPSTMEKSKLMINPGLSDQALRR